MRVSPGPTSPAGYDVVVAAGALRDPSAAVREAAPAAAYAVIADANVARLHGAAVCGALRGAGSQVVLLEFPVGEAHKTRETWAALTDAMLAAGFGRDCCVIALGGGVTADVAGFVAATYMRGVPVVQMPTSLLAMIDASVGGKAGVDTVAGKNLVGAFLQPRLVLVDPLVLRTLPDDEFRAGLAEAAKHAAIADAAYLDDIVGAAPALFAREPRQLASLIGRSVEIKANVVARDPHEHGERACLNFGHTIAHALERLATFQMRHGFAVSIGMVAEAEIGERVGITRPGTAAGLRVALRDLGLPVALPPNVVPADLIEAAATDKKARAGRLRFALIERLGMPARGPAGEWTLSLDTPVLRDALERIPRS